MHAALWRDGRLLATHKDGRSHLNAYLDDHAFLLGALLEVMQGDVLRPADVQWTARWRTCCSRSSRTCARAGFFFPPATTTRAGAAPGSRATTAPRRRGNGQWPRCTCSGGWNLTGEQRYLGTPRSGAMALFSADIERAPSGFGTLACALTEATAPPAVAILTGPAPALLPWRAALATHYLPEALVLQLPDDVRELPEALAKPVTPRRRPGVPWPAMPAAHQRHGHVA
ncbi:MAG: hypothetical protein IPO58_26955, partial [Betaproteobacteria bacterium]|nr:hypothetical protein [Betaproteobacteria bacterium]